ncbi:MAG: MFS transporter [Deltaproteobacteria bacterium]|nr:MFS transporter [Deltaproteobacteria bacterium]
MFQEEKSPKIFYGWFIVAACFIATFTCGEAVWSFGVFFKPMEKEFGWSRALISSGYTGFVLGYAISAMVAGRLADRYSPRPILFLSACLAGLGVSMCSQVQSINQLRFFLLIGGLGAGGTFSVPTSLVQRWFYKKPHAGLALGVVLAGIGVGAIVFTPLVNYFILISGWRNAYLVVGIVFFCTITLSSLIVKDSPAKTIIILEGAENMSSPVRNRDLTTAQILLNPSFIGITLIACSVSFAFTTVSVHLVPYAIDIGVTPTISALALGLLGGFSVPGRIISGFIADRVRWQKIMITSLFGLALLILLLSVLKAAWMLYCFVLFYGMFHGSRISAHVGILGEFFGMSSLGEIIGISMAVAMFTGAFAPYLAGLIFDSTGSYFIAFMIVMMLLLGGGIIATVITKPVQTK